MNMKTNHSNFIDKLLKLGFIPASNDGYNAEDCVYENYINGVSIFVILFGTGSIGVEMYNEETEEETRFAYNSSAPVMRIINKVIKSN